MKRSQRAAWRTPQEDATSEVIRGEVSHRQIAQISSRFNTQYQLPNAAQHSASDAALCCGHIAVYPLADGLSICGSNILVRRACQLAAIIPRSTTIAMLLQGAPIDASLSRTCGMQLSTGTAAMVNVSDAALMSNQVMTGTHAKTLIIQCNPEAIEDDELATAITRLTRSSEVRGLPFSPRANRLANEILRPPGDGLIHRLMTESFALEMIASMLEHIGRPCETGAGLSRRDCLRLTQVRDLLEVEPGRDHSLAALAREAGLSVASLKRKFPLLFGCSVFAFLRQARLDRARNGLRHEGWTIAEAAYFVGYTHVSNFSTAFRRRYGVTPGTLDKQ